MSALRRIGLIAVTGLLAICCQRPAWAADTLRVVATLSTFADLAKAVGGDLIQVSTIASPRFNPHFIEPKPSDVLKVKRADLFLHAGLDLELWRWPLVEAAGNRAVMPGGERELDLSRGISLLEIPDGPVNRQQGDIHLYGNPHYWLDPARARQVAQAIADKLAELDPANAGAYQANLDAWLQRLDARIEQWRADLAPFAGRELIGYHNTWPYLMAFAGLRMERFLEPKPGIPPTPKHLEATKAYMAEHRIPGIVLAGFEPSAAAKSLAKQAHARVVLLCQGVGEQPACGDYASLIDRNVRQLVEALANSGGGDG